MYTHACGRCEKMIVIKMHNEVSYSIVSRKYYNTGNDFDHNTSHSSFEAFYNNYITEST